MLGGDTFIESLSDTEKARYYLQLAENPNAAPDERADACYELGASYEKGELGLQQSYALAAEYYRKVVEQVHNRGDLKAIARMNLGHFHQDGLGNLKQSDEIAARYYLQVINDVNACLSIRTFSKIKLARMIISAETKIISDQQAAQYLQEIANDEEIPSFFRLKAIYYLGLYYQKGIGVSKSDEIAASYYDVVANNVDAGDDDRKSAQRNLELLRSGGATERLEIRKVLEQVHNRGDLKARDSIDFCSFDFLSTYRNTDPCIIS